MKYKFLNEKNKKRQNLQGSIFELKEKYFRVLSI